MSLLIGCQEISKSYGGRSLFQTLSFGIFSGDKIGLIGPNGSGKSTLLKILVGLETADSGSVSRSRFLRIGFVPQATIFPDVSLQELLITRLENTSHLSVENHLTEANIMLSKIGFKDPYVMASSLSGGWQKRLALAIELIGSPDLLLLDEPTNHLDLEGVIWLEKFLRNISCAYLVISHDRYFLEHVVNNMMELNRTYPKGMFSVNGSYSNFLEKRAEFLTGQLQQERSLASKVRREVEWLKQNPKARTTKSQSRIQEAQRLIQELQGIKSRNKEEKSELDFSSSQRESQKLLVATNVAKSMGGNLLFNDINLTLSPGIRLGIVGVNGSGKTTFLRLLAGELTPDKGTIKYADGIKIVYFDQHRCQLPSDISLRKALAPQGDTVYYNGSSIHVNSWCRRFLFSPDRLELPFGRLSGGEKARVHIARLMLEPADILLLDEPTNDLDIPTLEVLENSLLSFNGSIVIISHDRYMLDQISTVILGLGAPSGAMLFADYLQWEQYCAQQLESGAGSQEKIEKKEPISIQKRPAKITYSEKRECDQMEQNIMQTEKAIANLQILIQSNTLHQSQDLHRICIELEEKQKMLEKLYERWQELEIKRQSS